MRRGEAAGSRGGNAAGPVPGSAVNSNDSVDLTGFGRTKKKFELTRPPDPEAGFVERLDLGGESEEVEVALAMHFRLDRLLLVIQCGESDLRGWGVLIVDVKDEKRPSGGDENGVKAGERTFGAGMDEPTVADEGLIGGVDGWGTR